MCVKDAACPQFCQRHPLGSLHRGHGEIYNFCFEEKPFRCASARPLQAFFGVSASVKRRHPRKRESHSVSELDVYTEYQGG
jgi:hypothetical protein